jgi:hypothetical protein
MSLIARDVKRCPDFHTWNLSDQLEVCSGGRKPPLLQMKQMVQGTTSKPSLSHTVNLQDQYRTFQTHFFNQQGDRIPIESRRS